MLRCFQKLLKRVVIGELPNAKYSAVQLKLTLSKIFAGFLKTKDNWKKLRHRFEDSLNMSMLN